MPDTGIEATGDPRKISTQLGASTIATAQIVFLLIGVMAIVELVVAYNGFETDVATLEHAQILTFLAQWLDRVVGRPRSSSAS